MGIRYRIAAASVAAIALVGGGIGAAAAANASPTHPQAAVSAPTSPDNDAIQQGDQTSPDGTTAAAVGGETGSENSNESAPSDGPGGWADPSANAQHEFNGVE
jgi:hypothetical protein